MALLLTFTFGLIVCVSEVDFACALVDVLEGVWCRFCYNVRGAEFCGGWEPSRLAGLLAGGSGIFLPLYILLQQHIRLSPITVYTQIIAKQNYLYISVVEKPITIL